MNGNGRRRVVVTGIGAVTSLGNTVEDDLGGAHRGKLGRRPDHAVRHGGLPGELRVRGAGPRPDAVHRLQGVAADGPVHASRARGGPPGGGRSGLEIAPIDDRVGAAVATGIGGLKSFEMCVDQLNDRGPDRVNPFSIVQIIPNLAAGWVSMELGTRGPLLSQCTACAASNMAIGDGLDAIRLGRADVMFCGGTEAR